MHHDTALIAAYRGTAHVHELIAAWERNNAPVHIDPLPRHRYTVELLRTCGTREAYHNLKLNNLHGLLNSFRLLNIRGYLMVSKDGNFFTAKEV